MNEFEQDDHTTPVIFRKFGKKEGESVIAIFFEEPGSYLAYTCSSYMHVGQHGICEPYKLIGKTKLAKPDEYADLKAELEGAPYGYRLKVYKRMPHSSIEVRRRKLNKMT